MRLIILIILSIVKVIFLSALETSLDCAPDIVGIVCKFPQNTTANNQSVLIKTVNGFGVEINSSKIIEIELKSASNSVPQKLGEHFSGIENLIIHDSSLEHIQRSDFVGSLLRLEVLNLFGNQIKSIPHDTFYDLLQLRHLDVENNFITFLHPQLLVHAANLSVFAAGYNEIEEIHENFFEKNPKLWKVWLNENKIKKFGFNFTEFLVKFRNETNLRYINLSRNNGSCDILFSSKKIDVVDQLINFQTKEIQTYCQEPIEEYDEYQDCVIKDCEA